MMLETIEAFPTSEVMLKAVDILLGFMQSHDHLYPSHCLTLAGSDIDLGASARTALLISSSNRKVYKQDCGVQQMVTYIK